jgi:hypothetical protein
MIFEVQSFIEDYFHSRNLADPDRYAVALARLYDRTRYGTTEDGFMASMRRIRTVFYRRNGLLRGQQFDAQLLGRLDHRFKKKDSRLSTRQSPRALKSRAAA